MSTKGLKQSTEWVRKRVDSRRGYHPSAETLKRMSESKLGQKNPMYGKHQKESSKIKFKISMTGFRHSDKTKEKLRNIRLKYYDDHPESLERYRGERNPMFGKKGALSPMFGKRLPEEAKMKLRDSALGRYTGAKNPFYGKRHSNETKEKMKEKWKNRAFPEKDNKLEIKLQQALTRRGIIFEKNAKMLGRPDIFLQPNVCIFIDGCYWHGCPCKFDQTWTNPHAIYIKSRMQHDVKINEELAKTGFVVLRFKEHEINQDIEACVSLVLQKSTKKDVAT